MGQKVNPIGLRIGITRTWDSRWVAKPSEFPKYVYEDYLILAIGIIMQMYNYSFREVIVILERELKRKLPSLSTLHYRLSKLDNKLLEKIILKISKEIIKKKSLKKTHRP